MTGGRQVFLFVVWAKARPFEAEIRETLERDFKILLETEMSWPRWDFTRKLREFYGFGSRFAWWNKARKCGRGPFKVFLVEDDRPEFKPETDTRGQRQLVDERVYRDKQTLRRLTRHSNIVHSSTTAEETDAQMKVLFGCGTEELMSLLSCDLKFLAAGSRRACYEIPGTNLCLKCYRDEAEIANATVAREIRRCRYDERRNTCCQEYRYYQELKRRLPDYVFAAFPERLEQVRIPSRGWCLLEGRVRNADGTPCERFSHTYRAADEATQTKLLKEFWLLVGAFAAYGVRFYDPQNVLVQHLADGTFRLRVVDFEPASRTLFPIDSLCPAIVRRKVIRRAKRYLAAHCGVKMRYKGLKPSLRRKWDALIATEGAALGLSDCRIMLENKLVNDIFYEGSFKGLPCVVKCSSRAPESIANEYRTSARLFAADDGVCAEPLAHWASPDGKRAFVVMRRLPGPSLGQLMSGAVASGEAEAILGDFVRIAAALAKSGIVWRDVIPDNLLRDEFGHFRLIDAQFAFVRSDFHEDAFLQTHWKYRHLLFAQHPMMGGRGWNDVAMLLFLTSSLPSSEGVQGFRRRLRELAAAVAFPVEPSRFDLLRMRCILWEMRMRFPFVCGGRRRAALRERMARACRFLRVGPSAESFCVRSHQAERS